MAIPTDAVKPHVAQSTVLDSAPLQVARPTQNEQPQVIEQVIPRPQIVEPKNRIVVDSIPEGSDVEINGVAVGKTPMFMTLPWNVGRAYVVRVKKAGYLEKVYQMVVVPNTTVLNAELLPAR